MEKKELENEAEKKCKLNDQIHRDCFVDGYIKAAEPREKRIAKLEHKISILLSCKNCPENKGGLLCQKEYENKCLAQKIQFIKELQQENAELKADNDARKFAMAMSGKVEKQLREKNAELEAQIDKMKCCSNCRHSRTEYEHCRTDKHEKWEIKEK